MPPAVACAALWVIWRDLAISRPMPCLKRQRLVAPEAIALVEDADGEDQVVGREFLGHSWMYRVKSGDRQLRLLRPLSEDYERGQTCRLRLLPGSSVLLHPQRRALLSRAC